MKAWVYLMTLAAGLSGAAVAQNANPPPSPNDIPHGRAAPPVQGNRDPGADMVVVPRDNPGSTSVDRSSIEAPSTGNQTSDRAVSREWQGLGSTGGGTGTGESSGTTADEVAPGQDGNRPSNADTGNRPDADKAIEQNRTKPASE
jgi:hypothetical protein